MSDLTPVISVIIPVYNTATYLRECLDSVLGQTLKDLEVIVVDDGSSDGSWDIIQEYASNYPNLKAFQQRHKRQGAARNLGLLYARGEFVGFVDSDDKLPEDVYKHTCGIAREHDSDVVVGIIQSFNEKRIWRGVKLHARGLTEKFRTNITIADFPELLTDLSACNKIFRHSLITDKQVFFPEGCTGEDSYFVARLYLLAQNISVTPNITYFYRGRQNASTGILGEYFYRGRVMNTLALKKYFFDLNLQKFYPVFLCSEIRKLVASRLSKTIRSIPYKERMEIFKLLSSLTRDLSDEDIVGSDYFSAREQVRVFMLQQEEYDCLEMFETKPWVPGYLTLVKKRATYQKISGPLLRIYMQRIRALEKDKKLNVKVRFPKLFKAYERISKPYRRLRQASMRRHKAGIPLAPLLYYFFLFPIVKCINFFLDNKQVWLIDERVSRSAEDNGFFLFQYLRKHYPELIVYYVINEDSPDWERVEKLGPVIRQYSVAHAYYLLQAKVLLSTDSLSSLAFPAYIFRRLWRRTHNVFLQHGVMAVHKTIYTYKNYFYFSQIIASSEKEKQNFIKNYKFSEEIISITGLSRFDNLLQNDRDGKTRQVLVAPTWRLGLKTEKQVKNSKYYWAWLQLLGSPELTDLLNQYQATLLFRPHQNILPLISGDVENTERIRIQRDLTIPMFQLIKESDMLITDHSSIMFDFFYQEKPCICYMFDRKEVECAKGGKSYLDFDTELPADVHATVAEVVSSLKRYLKNGFTMPAEHRVKAARFFKYRDKKNCERIYQSIQKMIT